MFLVFVPLHLAKYLNFFWKEKFKAIAVLHPSLSCSRIYNTWRWFCVSSSGIICSSLDQRRWVEIAASDTFLKRICHAAGNPFTHQLVLSALHTAVSSLQPSAALPIPPYVCPSQELHAPASDGLLQILLFYSIVHEPRVSSGKHESLFMERTS